VPLTGKNVLLGVTGSIAAYKAVELASRMRASGADVHVVMTRNATEFVAPLTFATISRHPVQLDTFDTTRWEPEHTALADESDLFIVAPATANVLAKFAHGVADDLLSTLYLAIRCPTLVAPAMNAFMYAHPAVQENIRVLKTRGVTFSGPDYGMLACGYEGPGRLKAVDALYADVERLAATSSYVKGVYETKRDYAELRVVVTAGPTREPLDPVRFLSNRSSGRMGYALAEVAARRGARVTLVSGPTNLDTPTGVERVDVLTAREMHEATLRAAEDVDIIILSAAVADYEPDTVAPQKIKKHDETMTLTLRTTPDIARSLGERKGDRILVGFAAETENGIENARRKMTDKNLDLIVLNDVTQEGAGFETMTNIVTLLRPDGDAESLPRLSKSEVAEHILDTALALHRTAHTR
jgi:phosphopantothenoylcysteine decarboxylase/phosphopantothenate--cysteine ligase